MPQSLSRVLVHLVFSTYERTPWLEPEIRKEVHPFMGAMLRNEKCTTIAVGGWDDHVHLLFGLARTAMIAKTTERVKTSTTSMIKDKWPKLRSFSWQGGYAALSVGMSELDNVARYIRNQEDHHKKVSFKEELLALLTEYGIEYDERYLWD